jgi:hypothetical protein
VLLSSDDVRCDCDMFCILRASNNIDLSFIAEGPFDNRPSLLGPQNSC